MKLSPNVEMIVCEATGANSIARCEQIQSLWSGYGAILRLHLRGDWPEGDANGDSGGDIRCVIVKWVAPPSSDQGNHPRGWNTSDSHQRKLHSYDVESNWYRDWSERCNDWIRVPNAHAVQSHSAQHAVGQSHKNEHVFVLEDLDASGFNQRRHRLDMDEIQLGLTWLARFHACFIGESPIGLWPTGTYWHLATRQEELAAMQAGPLRDAAAQIDAKLESCQFPTIVHGDAKVANFCFRPDGSSLAAVDFQYVGGGCGMKDVAYFLSSCVSEDECEQYESTYLQIYFDALRDGLLAKSSSANVDTIDMDAIEREYRSLYPFAWADFTRFLLGWCPGHQKLNSYSERMTQQVLDQLA